MLIRISYLLLLVTVAIAAYLLVRMSRDDAEVSATFTGVERCSACHSSVDAGRQFATWQSSAHARAHAVLESDSARRAIAAAGDSARSCLGCHTTLGRAALSQAERPLVSEGVGCERCHGAGSRYAFYDVMRDRSAFTANGGAAGSLQDCYTCHAADPATAERHCPFQTAPFNADTAWLAIRHPINERAPKPDTVHELRP